MSLIKLSVEDVNSVVNHKTELMSFDEGLIELIIGWDLAKSRGAKITNSKIDEKTYWTFHPREKRNQFINDISNIEKIAFNYLINTKKVVNVNPLEFKNKEEFLNVIKKDFINFKVYLYNERLYLYDVNTIYHIDLGLLNFMSWDILNEIESIFEVRTLNIDGYRKYIENLDFKYIPYLIDAKENHIISNIC